MENVCYVVIPFHWTLFIAFGCLLILAILWYLTVRILVRTELERMYAQILKEVREMRER